MQVRGSPEVARARPRRPRSPPSASRDGRVGRSCAERWRRGGFLDTGPVTCSVAPDLLQGALVTGWDWLIILLYFALLLGLAWWVARRNKDTADDYFLAGRNLGWFLVGATIFASNIGSERVVGLAGAGATSGVALAHYELHAWCLLVLGWVFVPFYARALVYTMPEFLGRRFSPTARWVLSVITLAAHVLTKFAVAIFAGGVVFATLLPEVGLHVGGATFNSFWIGTVAVVLLTGLYTVLGGMRAVAYTDALQTFILVVGSGLLTAYGLARLGGWHELRRVLDPDRSEEHTSELQSQSNLVCRLLLEKKKKTDTTTATAQQAHV